MGRSKGKKIYTRDEISVENNGQCTSICVTYFLKFDLELHRKIF